MMIERAERHRKTPGYTKHEFHQLTGLPTSRIKKMIELGELKVVTLGGVMTIPPGELQRIRSLFEIKSD